MTPWIEKNPVLLGGQFAGVGNFAGMRGTDLTSKEREKKLAEAAVKFASSTTFRASDRDPHTVRHCMDFEPCTMQ